MGNRFVINVHSGRTTAGVSFVSSPDLCPCPFPGLCCWSGTGRSRAAVLVAGTVPCA